MSRKPRNLQPNYSYHITMRCNILESERLVVEVAQ
jgi:REP element-mobilizing transposase RayT